MVRWEENQTEGSRKPRQESVSRGGSLQRGLRGGQVAKCPPGSDYRQALGVLKQVFGEL